MKSDRKQHDEHHQCRRNTIGPQKRCRTYHHGRLGNIAAEAGKQGHQGNGNHHEETKEQAGTHEGHPQAFGKRFQSGSVTVYCNSANTAELCACVKMLTMTEVAQATTMTPADVVRQTPVSQAS